MIVQIDHIILAIDRTYYPELSSQLKAAGFVHADAGKHSGGTQNENVAFAGGAFLELLHEQSAGSGPAEWFGETPRVQGIGFSTNDYEHDIASWVNNPGAWDQQFSKTLVDGTVSTCQAAGPLPRHTFYPFVMDRPATPWGSLGASAVLREVTFAGAAYRQWHERFAGWFGLQGDDGSLNCGDAKLKFVDGPHPDMRASLSFDVATAGRQIPISGGTIELHEI